VQGREHVGSTRRRWESRDGEHACVSALDVVPIRNTDGGDGGCRCDHCEIASDFEEVACGSRVDYNWWGGVDILELIIWLILFKLLACSLCSAVPLVH
jgi:hypothetical protein